MADRILFVDDEPPVLEGYKRLLYREFDIVTALSGDEALAEIDAHGPYPVVVSDMRMPGMTGAQLLTAIRQKWPNMVRMLLTGHTDVSVAIEAINEGNVFRFLTKPCEKEVLTDALQAGLALHHKTCADQEIIRQATGENSTSVQGASEEDFESPTGLPGPGQARAFLTPLLGKGPQCYVLVYRLSTFHTIEQRYGEDAAFDCLNIAASFLSRALRPDDRLFHWDHDILLAVVHRQISSAAMRLDIARHLAGCRDHVIQVEGRSVMVSLPITIGVLLTNDFFTLTDLCSAFNASTIGTI